MLTQEQKEAEVKRRRSAGSASFPFHHADEKPVALFGISGSMYAVSQYAIYRIKTSDEIDPDVTQRDVPWSVGQYLSIGTLNPLIHGSFGVLKELDRSGLIGKPDKEIILEYLLEFAVSAAELSYAKRIYEDEFEQFKKNWEEGSGKPKLDGSAVQLPRFESYEISYSIFFSSAKRAIGKLLAILEWACGLEVTYRTHLDKLLIKLRSEKHLRDIHHVLGRLDGFVSGIEILNELRNTFEHPSPSANVQLMNVSMTPDGNVTLPTWTLVHDKIEMPENQDYGTHIRAITDMISRLAEHVIFISASAKDESRFAWEARLKGPEEIDKDFPCRWAVEFVGFYSSDSTAEPE